jgi:uncharacterized protein (DUF1330 family)
MACFLVATVKITDPERFATYALAASGLSPLFGAESVLKGAVSEVIEGESEIGERVVIVRFDTLEAAHAYIDSEQYQSARKLREGAAEVVMRLINQ